MVKLSWVLLLVDVEWFVVRTECVTWDDDLVSSFGMMTTKVNHFNATVVWAWPKLFGDKSSPIGMESINPNVANFDLHGVWGVVERIVSLLHKHLDCCGISPCSLSMYHDSMNLSNFFF